MVRTDGEISALAMLITTVKCNPEGHYMMTFCDGVLSENNVHEYCYYKHIWRHTCDLGVPAQQNKKSISCLPQCSSASAYNNF